MSASNDLARRAERRAMIGSYAGRSFEALRLRELLVLLEPCDASEGGRLPPWVRRRLHLLVTPSSAMRELLRADTRFGISLFELLDFYLEPHGLDVAYRFEVDRSRMSANVDGHPRAELRAEALRVVAEAGAPALPRGTGRAHVLASIITQ